MKIPFRLGLRWKIGFLIVLLLFLVLLGVRTIVLPNVKQALTKEMIDGGKSVLAYLTTPAQEALLIRDEDDPTGKKRFPDTLKLQQLAKKAIAHPNIVYSYIIDQDNIIQAYDEEGKTAGLIGQEYKETRVLVAVVSTDQDVLIKEEKKRDILDLEQPIKVGELKVGAAKIGLSKKRINQEVKKTITTAVVVTLAILVVGIIGAFILAHFLVIPIKLLAEGTVEIAKGHFDKIIPVKSHDELGDLTKAFNTMARGLREREQMKDAFSRLVSKDVMHEIMSDLDSVKLRGERKEVTIFISDVRGFTTTSERMKAEEVVQVLNEYFERMTEIVFRNRGTIDKYMGDGLLALFGAPKAYGDDPKSAVKAALEMQEEVDKLQKKWSAEGKPEFKIGIGINTGEVIVGFMGSSQKMEYTVIGDNVNLCSRLEGLNKNYGTTILISEHTYNKVKDYFEAKDLGEASVKGKEEKVHVFEVLGWKQGVSQN